jgi:hypothetical protein
MAVNALVFAIRADASFARTLGNNAAIMTAVTNMASIAADQTELAMYVVTPYYIR